MGGAEGEWGGFGDVYRILTGGPDGLCVVVFCLFILFFRKIFHSKVTTVNNILCVP